MDQNKNLAISPILTTEKPNEKIIIYDGEFKLKNSKSESLIIKGEIYFKWFPHIGPKFKGEVQDNELTISVFSEEKFNLEIHGNVVSECYISNQNIGELHTISGGFNNEIILGDKSLTSQKFKFSLLNFEDYLGESIKYETERGVTYSRARMLLSNEKFEILIDKDINYKSKYSLLKEDGGFTILYNGEVNILKGSFDYIQISDLMEILGNFLSFVCGKRNTPLFLSAIHEEKILYQDFTGYYNHPYEYRPSWSNTYTTEYLNSLFQNFYKLWKSNPDNKFFLQSIIHWYTEINCNRGYPEGSLILAQTALELLYNWLIIENKKLILGKDTENLSASNKIRLLISHLSISYEVPTKFNRLEKYRKDSKLADAVESIVQIRNAIVHSQEEKRKKLSEIDSMTIYESVQLCLWYIELSILYILEFESKYSNRCSKELVKSYKLEATPWKK